MLSKNEIEMFFVRSIKQLLGRGPKNVIVKKNMYRINVTISGITSRYEEEILKYFPEQEKRMVELRNRLFHKKFESNMYGFEKMFGGRILGVNIRHSFREDKADMKIMIAAEN